MKKLLAIITILVLSNTGFISHAEEQSKMDKVMSLLAKAAPALRINSAWNPAAALLKADNKPVPAQVNQPQQKEFDRAVKSFASNLAQMPLADNNNSPTSPHRFECLNKQLFPGYYAKEDYERDIKYFVAAVLNERYDTISPIRKLYIYNLVTLSLGITRDSDSKPVHELLLLSLGDISIFAKACDNGDMEMFSVHIADVEKFLKVPGNLSGPLTSIPELLRTPLHIFRAYELEQNEKDLKAYYCAAPGEQQTLAEQCEGTATDGTIQEKIFEGRFSDLTLAQKGELFNLTKDITYRIKIEDPQKTDYGKTFFVYPIKSWSRQAKQSDAYYFAETYPDNSMTIYSAPANSGYVAPLDGKSLSDGRPVPEEKKQYLHIFKKAEMIEALAFTAHCKAAKNKTYSKI